MNLREIGVIYRKELLDSLRDKRTLISMIVVPLVLIPLLTLGLGCLSMKLIQQSREQAVRVMVLGGEDSPATLESLKRLPSVELVPPSSDYGDQIIARTIRAAVRIPSGFDQRLEQDKNATVTIYMYAGELRSEFAAAMLRRFFEQVRTLRMQARLESHPLPSAFMQPLAIEEKNVAPPEKVGATLVGGLIPYFVIVLCLTGAMYPAIDMTAGEKERGTMETILSSPISRTDLVLGKFLMVLTASLATGALLAIALFARSFREAQSYLSPLTIVVVAPAVMALVPGMELSARLTIIPVLSTSLVSKEIMSGVYEWRYIGLIFGSSCLYAAIALLIAVKLFNREEVLFRT